MDLKTAFLQGETYDVLRDVVCQLPPASGHPPHMSARLKKPAYGMNDAPRCWWNKIDASLRSYGMIPTRADRCCYVLYTGERSLKTPKQQKHQGTDFEDKGDIPISFEQAMDYLLDPASGSPSKGRAVAGVVNLHVDDLFIVGGEELEQKVLSRIRKDYQVGSEGTNDVTFCGQRVRWIKEPHWRIEVDQQQAIEELREIQHDKTLKDDIACNASLHTNYRSVLGSLNWLQSRTQFQIACSFSLCLGCCRTYHW
jgi:hypothetical protein